MQKRIRAGLLALGLISALLVAVPVSASSRTYKAISSGFDYACALTTAGKAYCWGDNRVGQLGNSDGTHADQDHSVAVDTDLQFKSITAGYSHACALTSAGVAYCWGVNINGQLGNGDTTSYDAPVLVDTVQTFKSISAGTDHTCALNSEGVAFCWGKNADAQLGTGDTTEHHAPYAVDTALKFKSIAASELHTCALTKARAAYCWGDNGEGYLGNSGLDGGVDQGTPGAVDTDLKFTSITAGIYHTCALTKARAVYCWGSNEYGQLGDGTNENAGSPVEMDLSGVSGKIASIAAGSSAYSTCVVTTKGNVYCTGYGGYGVFGDGNDGDSTTLVPGATGLKVKTVVVSDYNGYGLTKDGKAYAWGDDGDSGQLGNGADGENRYHPVLVQ
jgi:alpha-tubulin suppressor-like RCC1 family protein